MAQRGQAPGPGHTASSGQSWGGAQGQPYLVHQQLGIGLDWYTDHVGAVDGLPVRGKAAGPSDGGAVAAGPSSSHGAPYFPAGETEAQRRQVTGRRPHPAGQKRGPQLSGQHPPHGLVLEAEAGAGAVEVVTGAAVVQQAGRTGEALVWVVGSELCTPHPSWPTSATPSSREKAGPSRTLGLTFSFCSSDRAPNHLTQEKR